MENNHSFQYFKLYSAQDKIDHELTDTKASEHANLSSLSSVTLAKEHFFKLDPSLFLTHFAHIEMLLLVEFYLFQ